VSPLALLFGSAMLLAVHSHARLAQPLWVEVDSGVDCPGEPALLAALRARLGQAEVRSGRAPSGGMELRLVARGSRAVTIILRERGALLVKRDLDVPPGECAALAHTCALIAEAWLIPPRSKPRPGKVAAVPAPPEAAAAASPEAAAPSPPVSEPSPAELDAAKPGPPTEPVSSRGPAPEVAAKGTLATQQREVTVPSTRPSPTADTPVSRRRAWSLMVAASTGSTVALQGHAPMVITARLDISGGYGAWRLGLRGAFETSRDLDPSPNLLLVRYWPAGIYAGRVLIDRPRWVFGALAGAGVDFVETRSSGYAAPRGFSSINPVGFGGLGCLWRLAVRFSLVGIAEVAVAGQTDRFYVGNAGEVARTARVRAGLSLGAAWHLR
jgi:hypothetical protein